MYNNSLQRLLDQFERDRAKLLAVADRQAQMLRQFEELRANITGTLEPIMSSLSQLAGIAEAAWREAYPPNWPAGIEADLPLIEAIVEDEGIPLIYVPRSEIVAELLAAPDFEARLAIVEQRAEDIAQDCREALKVPTHVEIEDRAILARKAVEAFLDGHHEAAQALAVVVCDSFLKAHIGGRYEKMREELELDKSDELGLWPTFRLFMPMATAVPFLKTWRHGDPLLTTFSRHFTIHGAGTAQLNRLHAALAIMLVASMTCALDAGIARYGERTVAKANHLLTNDESDESSEQAR